MVKCDESKERDRLAFAFMANGISSERQVETAVRQTMHLMQQAREQKLKIVVVAGPVVVHTGGVAPLSELIRNGWVDSLLAGNALGVHDIENSLLGTSLGVRQADGRHRERGGLRQAHNRRYVRMREVRRALCAGGQPAR